jgi:hypothetical protein
MKGYMKWANAWRDKYSSVGDFEETGQQEPRVAGFICARERAAGLIESFDNTKDRALPLLIRAIGESKIDAEGMTATDE